MTYSQTPRSVPAGTLSPRFLRGLYLWLIFPACCPCARAQSPAPQAEAAGSTVPAAGAAAPAQGSLMLNILKNSDQSRVGLDYSVRWDFSDLLSFRPGFKVISSGVKALTSWDITKNTRFSYYGFKTNPWRVIMAEEPAPPGAGEARPAGQTGGGVVSRAAPASRKRLRLSVSPLVEDFKRDFSDNLRELLLRDSLKGVSPQWARAGKEGRREFVRDVLSLGIWDAPLPGMAEGRGGLEYLSEESSAKSGAKVQRSTSPPPGFRINSSTGAFPQ